VVKSRGRAIASSSRKKLDSRSELRRAVVSLLKEAEMEQKRQAMLSPLVRDDGYTITTHVREAKGMYPAVTFVRRPTGVYQRAGYLDVSEPMGQVDKAKTAAAMISRMLISWDVKDHKGVAVDTSESNVEALHPDLFARMRNIICLCVDGGDDLQSDQPSETQNPSAKDFLDGLQKN
jgi:hypothetical protein